MHSHVASQTTAAGWKCIHWGKNAQPSGIANNSCTLEVRPLGKCCTAAWHREQQLHVGSASAGKIMHSRISRVASQTTAARWKCARWENNAQPRGIANDSCRLEVRPLGKCCTAAWHRKQQLQVGSASTGAKMHSRVASRTTAARWKCARWENAAQPRGIANNSCTLEVRPLGK